MQKFYIGVDAVGEVVYDEEGVEILDDDCLYGSRHSQAQLWALIKAAVEAQP